MLLERHAHLNQLRVGTVQVYLVVAAAVLALWGGTDALAEPNSYVAPLGMCLIGVGLLVYTYDLRLRARTYAVAAEVARCTAEQGSGQPRIEPKLLDEDLAFSLILMLVNSTLVYIGLVHWFSAMTPGDLVPLVLSAGFFALQALLHIWCWPRLAQRLSAWPDAIAHTGTQDHEN